MSMMPVLTTQPHREGPMPGGVSPPLSHAEPMPEHMAFEVTSCIIQSLEEKEEEVEEGSVVVVATN